MYTLTQEALYGDINVFDDGFKDPETGDYEFIVDVCADNIPVTGKIGRIPVFLKCALYSDEHAMYKVIYKED